jgi:hypothetical protein
MRASSVVLGVGFSALAGMFAFVGCSSDEGGSGTAATSAQSSADATSGGPGAGSGGAGTTSGSGGAGGSTTTTSSTSGAGGSGGGPQGYQTCGQCTTGSPLAECKTQKAACDKDPENNNGKGCSDIFDCVFNCSTDHDGGCCALACNTSTGAKQASIDLFKAYDNCVYCMTCKTLCTDPPSYDATEYCKATSGASACP